MWIFVFAYLFIWFVFACLSIFLYLYLHFYSYFLYLSLYFHDYPCCFAELVNWHQGRMGATDLPTLRPNKPFKSKGGGCVIFIQNQTKILQYSYWYSQDILTLRPIAQTSHSNLRAEVAWYSLDILINCLGKIKEMDFSYMCETK